jgi:cell division initiation protein
MIDLTPLDVRKKRGDFHRSLRGYDPDEVDQFLELVSERLEELVRQNRDLSEEATRLREQVEGQEGRERAVHEALVTAQELRKNIREQAEKEAELVIREAEEDAREIRARAEVEVRRVREEVSRSVDEGREALEFLERDRQRFLRYLRRNLERQMDALEEEEAREPDYSFPDESDLLPSAEARGMSREQARDADVHDGEEQVMSEPDELDVPTPPHSRS